MEDDGMSSADPSSKTLEQKRVAMLERLSNRHNSRTTTTSSSALPDPSQSTQSFLSNFSESKLSIESHLSELRQNPGSGPSHKPQLESISLQLSALEKLIAENSYYLPPYEVRSCLSSIDILRRSLDEVTSLVIPKKKFSFKSKTKSTAITPVAPVRKVERKTYTGPERLGLGFRDRENEVLVNEFSRSELEGQSGEFTLSGLRKCEVRLKGCVRALFVDKLVDCKVYVGAVMGSVLIEGAERCVFVLASHQIRIHEAKECDFYLRVRSRPIIEDCSGVRFGPYCLNYQGIVGDLEEARLAEETENWVNVDDFRWLRAVQSPNWSVLPEGERISVVDIS